MERNRRETRLFKAELQDRTRRITMLESRRPEELLSTALSAFEAGNGYATVLDRLPVPVYATDTDGLVTYWNQACIDFAGREPQLGRDRWCVTWQLYTMGGERLPH